MVKEEKRKEAKTVFSVTNVNITSTGKHHLGAVIGSQEYKNEYVDELVSRWTKELAKKNCRNSTASSVFSLRTWFSWKIQSHPCFFWFTSKLRHGKKFTCTT